MQVRLCYIVRAEKCLDAVESYQGHSRRKSSFLKRRTRGTSCTHTAGPHLAGHQLSREHEQASTMGPRGDKRDANQLRPLACEVGVLERADGSARFSQGHSCVLASVVGPADVSVRDEVSALRPSQTDSNLFMVACSGQLLAVCDTNCSWLILTSSVQL